MKFRVILSTLCYGIGSIPYGTSGAIMGFYLNIFLLDNVKMDPLYVAIIIFGGRVWDAITDPIVGYFLVFTPWTCFGRLKLWILLGFIPMSIFYFLLWQDFFFSSNAAIFTYFLAIYLIFQTSTTVYHLPFTALVLFISENLEVRDLATVFRMVFEVIGVFIGVGSHTIFLATLGNDTISCDNELSNFSGIPSQNNSGYFWSSVFNSILIFLSVFFLIFGTKELKPILTSESNKDNFILKIRQIVTALKFRPYCILLIIYLFTWLSVQILQANYALFAKHVLMMNEGYLYLLILMVFSMIFSMFPWQVLMFYLGKKLILIIGSFIVLFCLLVVLLFLDNSTLFLNYTVSVFSGIGVSTFYLVPWSMLPDVSDAALLQIGFGMQEIFFSFFVFFSKFGAGVALGVSTLSLKLFGFDSGKCIQPKEVQIGLRLLITVLPFILICCALITLVFYPITELQRKVNHKLLIKKRDLKQNEDHLGESGRVFNYNSISNIFVKSSE